MKWIQKNFKVNLKDIIYKIRKQENVMKLDVLGLMAACSYALDCVEAELVHVTNNHAKRVAYMSVSIAGKMGV